MTSTHADPMLWIRRYHDAPGSTVRLVCFPHAGGSASFYFPVSAALAPDVEVLAVQYPGRQDRRAEANVDTIPAMADAIFAAVRPLSDRPLALFGHSMGAVLAYEVALRLEGAGAPPLVRLFVSGRRAPSRYRPDSISDRGDQGILDELRLLSGTTGAVLGDPEVLEMVLPAIRSDFRAIERYRHRPGDLLSCPVVTLLGDQDPRVTVDEANAWAGHSTGPHRLRIFQGGHFYLAERAPEVIRAVAEELSGGGR
nr:alpha/beta fold hydrolase [Micromonospora sp. DSM 115978]